jgi:hypothetical protein
VRGSLGRIDPRADWPHGFVRFGVAVWVALAVVLGLVYFVRAVDRLGDDAGGNAASSYEDRAFGGASGLGLDEDALTEARGRIPENEPYRLLVGPGAENIGQYARYFLMPRRPDPNARWVLCYRCDLASLGGELRVVWRNDDGVVLGRLPA